MCSDLDLHHWDHGDADAWISTLTVVQNRPQHSSQKDPQVQESNVELEKQTIIELNTNNRKPNHTAQPTQRKIEERTKDILEKIEEVNKKQGLTRRKEKPNYFHFPFSYSRSQEESKAANDRQGNHFQFPNNPFSNPIFDYLERERPDKGNTRLRNDLSVQEHNVTSTVNQPELGITKDDIIPNQYGMPPYIIPPSMGIPQRSPSVTSLNPQQANKTNNEKASFSHLEKQTIDNVRNIVSNAQVYPPSYNPYLQYLYTRYAPSQYPYYGPLLPYSQSIEPQNSNDNFNQKFSDSYMAELAKGRQNWNWPGASYFPIYIRDPFLQIYNAITSMVEYGPNAGQGGPCKRPNKNKLGKDDPPTTREAKTTENSEPKEHITFEINDNNAPQISIYSADGEGENNNSGYLDIENIDIGANDQSSLKFTVNVKPSERGGKESESKVLKTSWDQITESGKSNSTHSNTKLKFEDGKQFRPPLLFKPTTKPTESVVHQSADDDDDDTDEEKADGVAISNDGNKKLFSRDNTGSGIFIHKLKVRKGGVAIAGPGGIATAGSGGTAIVGPNGIAYTQPDSLAIAGSGTKVVAVDPSVNLGDLISNSINNGGNTSSEAFPPSRVGRVVAVGPVVYYNRG
ncbi:hypothetical protein NQ317_016489 [Molorchus minor]|uniref:DUF4774 domain-containing protein n=1 Tax=Molorchus minor TaxID=1323400 RepID=A0ABQ9JFV0_9CUCU|nr:hypothetical protein NQ317_016489 [Molorchus minor]